MSFNTSKGSNMFQASPATGVSDKLCTV